MLTSTVIGHLGGDAECKSANGKEFVTFRVANTDRWTDDAGQVHESTTWIDCIMNGKPGVFPYLKKGQLIFASGAVSLRVYSSPKDKCMKAGMTINVRNIELLGGKTDDVPSLLYSEDGKTEHRVGKFFYAQTAAHPTAPGTLLTLVSRSGEQFVADTEGWIRRAAETSQG